MDVSAHAIGRESKGVTGADAVVEVAAGTSTADGEFIMNVDGKDHKIAITKDMTAEDFENKLNNIEGLSGIEVSDTVAADIVRTGGAAATPSTLAATGLALDTEDTLALKVGDEAEITLTATDIASKNAFDTKMQSLTDAGYTIEATTAEAKGAGAVTGFTITDPNGANVDVTATLANTTGTISDTAALTIGGMGVNKTTSEATVAMTGGIPATDPDTGKASSGFDISFKNMKVDTNISTLTYKGEIAANDGGDVEAPVRAAATGTELTINHETVTTESVASLDLSTAEGAQNAIDVLDSAMEQVDEKRAEIGAFQNRMTHTMSNLANINENVNASNSRIKDVDFASETINMTKGQILQQAGTSILAQAKQIPQAALSLLG
ncbi:flagellin [Photobacterium phosphoreum]|uniref:flagellin n=1 Tax=Photobacterium phosphoreum TaxID=659 RepID=UPI003D2F4091